MDDLERELAPRDELLESKVRWMRELETQAARWDLPPSTCYTCRR